LYIVGKTAKLNRIDTTDNYDEKKNIQIRINRYFSD